MKLPQIGDQYSHRLTHQVVTVDSVWAAEDGCTAVSYQWRDDKPGQCGGASNLDVFHRTYQPADLKG